MQCLQKNTETLQQFCEGLELEIAFCCCMGSCVTMIIYLMFMMEQPLTGMAA